MYVYVLVAGVYVRVRRGEGVGGGGTHQAQGAGVPSTLNPSYSPAVLSSAPELDIKLTQLKGSNNSRNIFSSLSNIYINLTNSIIQAFILEYFQVTGVVVQIPFSRE